MHAHSGTIPAGVPRRQGHDSPITDRHRQDGRLRALHLQQAHERRRALGQAPRARYGPHKGARRAGRAGRQQARQVPASKDPGNLRRGRLRPPGFGSQGRHRPRGGHPRQDDRPLQIKDALA